MSRIAPADALKQCDTKKAAKDGWQICKNDRRVFEIMPVGEAFASPQALLEHIAAMAWRGSPNHNDAMLFLECHSPIVYSEMGSTI